MEAQRDKGLKSGSGDPEPIDLVTELSAILLS